MELPAPAFFAWVYLTEQPAWASLPCYFSPIWRVTICTGPLSILSRPDQGKDDAGGCGGLRFHFNMLNAYVNARRLSEIVRYDRSG